MSEPTNGVMDPSAFDPEPGRNERIIASIAGFNEKYQTDDKFRERADRRSKAKSTSSKADYNDLTRNWLREREYFPVRVDYYDHSQQKAHDLLGLFDYLALGDNQTLAVQITSKVNASTRQNKILLSSNYKYAKKAGWKILVLAWSKGTNGRWIAEERWL